MREERKGRMWEGKRKGEGDEGRGRCMEEEPERKRKRKSEMKDMSRCLANGGTV